MSRESEVSRGAVRQLREIWEVRTWELLGPAWDAAFSDWIKKFGFALVADAVQKASVSGYSEDGRRVPPDIRDVPKYAAVMQAEEQEPGMQDCYFVRGRIRKKFYCDDSENEVLSLLRKLMRSGVSATTMRQAVDESWTIEECFVSMGLDKHEFRIAMGHPIADLPPKEQFFIRHEDSEWPIWDAYWRRTKGVGAPMNKHFGWYFPSRLPPTNLRSNTMANEN